jgi:hypothetical protein
LVEICATRANYDEPSLPGLFFDIVLAHLKSFDRAWWLKENFVTLFAELVPLCCHSPKSFQH